MTIAIIRVIRPLIASVGSLAILVSYAPFAKADDSLEELLAKWKNPLDQLSSASFEMTISNKRPDDAASTVKVKYSFDQALGAAKASIKHSTKSLGGDWLRNQQYLAHSVNGNPIIAIQTPTTPLLRWATEWDVQYLGLALYGDLLHEIKRQKMESDYNRLRKERKYAIKQVGAFTMAEVVVSDEGTERIRMQITFDPKKAYAIVAQDYYLKPRGSDTYSHASSSQLEYDSFGSLWLPVKARFRGHANEIADVSIKWSEVNSPFTETDFAVTSMDLPDSHIIEDLTQGYQKDKKMRRLGDLRSSKGLLPTDAVQTDLKPRDWTRTATLGCVLASLAAVTMLVVRRRAKKIDPHS